jgi:hypothetical protein
MLLLMTALLASAQPNLCQLEPADPVLPKVLPLRQQAKIEDAWLKERLETIVPKLMREQGVDMWVMVAREYLEDPVVETMLDAESMHARRRTILVFYDPGEGKPFEKLTVSRYGLGGLFAPVWKPEEQPDQWKALADVIVARNPKKIALNVSPMSAFADGLTASQRDGVVSALSPELRARIVPADKLAIGWLETRIPAEMAVYPEIVRTAHAIIAEGLSGDVIKPGVTTADDVVWWYRERIAGLKLDTWFQPSLGISRPGTTEVLEGDTVIQPGDLLWTDFGITYMGLNTDTQHMAYVLKPGETIAEGLDPTIYSHPIGYHGHAAGTPIGMWDNQNARAEGEYPVMPNTAWSIELNAKAAVPEWGGQVVPFRLEEDAYFDGKTVQYIDGRQTKYHLIPRTRKPTTDCPK